MESSSVVIEVTGWSDWVRREWAERAPKTLAELHDPDAFAAIDGELSAKYAERTRALGRIVDADVLLTQIASGIPVEQCTSLARRTPTRSRRTGDRLPSIRPSGARSTS